MFWLLRSMKHEVASEWKLPNGYADLCDKTTRTLYEIELHCSPKYRSRKLAQYRVPGYEIIIVDCSKMPEDIEGMRKYLETFILPD